MLPLQAEQILLHLLMLPLQAEQMILHLLMLPLQAEQMIMVEVEVEAMVGVTL